MLNRIVSSAAFGLGVTAVSTLYNEAGVEGKLPENAGYVHPPRVFSCFLGASAFFIKATLPARFVLPAVVLTGVALTTKAINNSIREIREPSTFKEVQ